VPQECESQKAETSASNIACKMTTSLCASSFDKRQAQAQLLHQFFTDADNSKLLYSPQQLQDVDT
jgi:hypothetical protein